jgi:hypothetical protein
MTACVFRVAVTRAPYSALLADGTFVRVGEPIGSLHFWNEHLARFPHAGPDLHWAKIMQLRVRRSLEELCRHVEENPAWAEVTAIRAEAALPRRPLAGPQLQRVARRFGFEARHAPPVPRGRVSLVAENILLWGFARAYNPLALSRHHLLQGRQELWLSRKALIANYSYQPPIALTPM